jgi:transcriptional regulator with XRE-family HTH domain
MPASFGEALRRLREQRGLSLDQAAKRAGLRKDVLFRYETGIMANPTATTLARLATAYNTTVEHLLSLLEQKQPLYLRNALADPTLPVYWHEDRPLTHEQREVLTELIDFWLRLTGPDLPRLLPPDERQVLEQYRAHRDRFQDRPDLEVLAALAALLGRRQQTQAEEPPPPSPPATPRTRPDQGEPHPKR